MPRESSLPKIEATRHYGARVELGGESVDECIALAVAFAQAHGAVYVPPFDDPLVAAGQGTVGLELAEEAPPLEAVIVPVGGGGLIAGVARAIRSQMPGARIIGVEATGAASMTAALREGRPVELPSARTVADGIAVRRVCDLTLAHVTADVDDVVCVDDETISRAVVLLLERAKWVVEPAGAVGVAALLAGAIAGDGPVGVVLSGGNVDPLLLSRLIDHGLTASGRYLLLRVVVDDRPGTLAALTAAIAAMNLNVLGVEHHRSGTVVGVAEVEVLMTVETRDPQHRDAVVATLREAGFDASIRS
jgi:threonine dehydratase